MVKLCWILASLQEGKINYSAAGPRGRWKWSVVWVRVNEGFRGGIGKESEAKPDIIGSLQPHVCPSQCCTQTKAWGASQNYQPLQTHSGAPPLLFSKSSFKF